MGISVAVCVYNDFDFLAESLERIAEFAEEIVILDGPYVYCEPMLKYFGLYYTEPPAPLKAILAHPKVRYHYEVYPDERAKRIALYEMCRGDIVMLLDSDELVTAIRPEAIAAFEASDKSVAGARFQNHVRSNVLSTEDTRKLIFFKRRQVTAEQHLNYTWLVGIRQDEPNRAIILDRGLPLVDIAHLTLMRSPYYSTVKYCFYTRLYFHSRGETAQVGKLFGRTFAELAASGLPMETVRDIFRRSVTDSLNFPVNEKLSRAPPAVAIDPAYDKVAAIEYLDERAELSLLNGVNSHYFIKVPEHLKAGDPLAFSFRTADVAGMAVEGVFHNGDRCERVTAEVRISGANEFHGELKLPFDGGGWFGSLIMFRPRCAAAAKLGRVSGFRLKKRLGFYGDCQTENVVDFLEALPGFAREYEVDRTPGRLAHMMSEEEIKTFHERAHRLDYLILQPVSDEFRGSAFGSTAVIAALRPQARVFLMSNLFVTAYAPDCYKVTYRKKFLQQPMKIHDVNFIYAYLKHRRDRELTEEDYRAKLDAPGFYSPEALKRRLDQNVAELAEQERHAREKYPLENGCFLAYSEFVAGHYDKALLHYSGAHPTEYVFNALARQVADDLQIAEPAAAATAALLKEKGALPFYRAVGEAFGFDARETPIYVNNRRVEFDDYFKAYCDVYDSHSLEELFGYVSQHVAKVVVTNHKTGTKLMERVLRDYCQAFGLKLLDVNEHLSARGQKFDFSFDYQAFDFIFVAHAQHFEELVEAVPDLRYRAIHMIRHPLEIIASGARFHRITDERWCNVRIFVADPAHPAGYRRIAQYDVDSEGERGEFTYREIMNRLAERERIAFEIRQHASTHGGIPAIRHFLSRFRDDGNVATLRLEDVATPECVAFVFKFLALREEFLPAYRLLVEDKSWLGAHVTHPETHPTYANVFDDPMLSLFRDRLGERTIADFGYAADSPPPIYLRKEEAPPRPAPAPPAEASAPVTLKPKRPRERANAGELFALGDTHMNSGENTLAKQAFERALEADEYNIGALGRLGDLCCRIGLYQEAVNHYRRIEGLTDDPPGWLFVGLSNALEALGDKPEALRNLRRAMQLGENSAAVRARLARLSS